MWCAPPLHSLGGPSRDLTDRCSVRLRGSDDVRPVWNRAPWLCRLPAATGHLRATLRRPYASGRLGATAHASTRPFLGRARRLAAAQVPSSLACGGTTAPRSTSIPGAKGPSDLGSADPPTPAPPSVAPKVLRNAGPRRPPTSRAGGSNARLCALIQPFARRLALHVLGRTANHRRREPRTRCASRDGGRGSALRGHSFLMSLVVSLSTSRPIRLSHRLLRATHNRALC